MNPSAHIEIERRRAAEHAARLRHAHRQAPTPPQRGRPRSWLFWLRPARASR